MNHWYLVASLPYLRFGEKSPMDVAGFRIACAGHLSAEEIAVVEASLENRQPPAFAGLRRGRPAGVAQAWWNGEVQLRNAVVRVRARNRGTEAAHFIHSHEGFSVTIEKMVADAFTRPNPMEKEAELDRARWALADELAIADSFGFAAVLAFAVKLRIAERWTAFDAAASHEKTEELVLSAFEAEELITN